MVNMPSYATAPDLGSMMSTGGLTSGLPVPQVPASALQPPAGAQQAAPQSSKIQQLMEASQNRKQAIAQSPEAQKALTDALQDEAAPPERPDENYRSSLNAFKDLAPALVVLGGALTGQPLMGAMAAATGAMEGYNKGDKARVDLSMQKWHDAMDEWKTKHEMIKEKAGRVIDKDGNVHWDYLAAYAAAHGNKEMIYWLQHDPDKALKMYMDIEKFSAELSEKYAQAEKYRADAAKRKTTGEATLSEAAIANLGEAVHNGAKLSTLGLGYGTNPNKTAVLNYIGDKYPDFDLAGAELDYQGRQQERRTTEVAASKIKVAANSLKRSLPLLKEAASGVDLSRFPSINALENYVRTHKGDKNIEKLLVAVRTAATDYSNLIARNGQATDATRSAAIELVNQNMSTGQIDGFIEQVGLEEEAQLKAIEDSLGNTPKGSTNAPPPPPPGFNVVQ